MTVYSYIQVTNFFWMLVEGLYLHTMIVWAFSADKIRFWYYALLGWGKYSKVTAKSTYNVVTLKVSIFQRFGQQINYIL